MLIDFSSFQQVFNWVIANGYWLMFLAMCIEGPTITTAGAFGSALGYFNPFAVFALSILGDVVPDSLYYWLGRWGRLSLATKVSQKFGISEKRILDLEAHIKLHGGKTVAVLKYTPILAVPGLILVGAMQMDWWKYIKTVLVVTSQRTVVLMILGYFFGRTYDIGKYIKYGATVPLVILLAYVMLVWLYGKYSKRIAFKLEKI